MVENTPCSTQVAAALVACGLPSETRAQDLTLETFVRFYNTLGAQRSANKLALFKVDNVNAEQEFL